MQQATQKKVVPEISDYEILAKIGQGGSARIYKARQKSLNRYVAIKILSPELSSNPEIVKRFDRESITIAGLSHPNIVHIIDRGKVDDQYYFVMEFVDGTSFKEVVLSKKYTIRQKLEILVMVLKGLDYAHKNGVIHRDVKPANVLIDKQGNALIADFGIAQILNKSDHEVTRSDIVMGTLAYMSPEQRVSSRNVELTTDIFSVGVILYEILTARRPQGKYIPPSELNPKIPAAFDNVVAHCLDMDPQNRFQTAVELKDAILNLMSGKSYQGITPKDGIGGVESFIGKCQFLDTIKETKYSTTLLVENRESRELYVIKKNDKCSNGLKEARILSKLKHDNIINIFGAGGDERRLVVVMEYCQGGSLSDRMVKTYPVDKAMRIISDISGGLEFAHRNGIIHGNLRPSNILFNKDETLRLTDFGLPPHYNLMEKNWYAPPEKRISKQGDIYALGVILHNLIYGKNPVYDRAANLTLGRSEGYLPRLLEEILKKLLAFKIANRYPDLEEFFIYWTRLERGLSRRRKRPSVKSTSGQTGLKLSALKITVGIITVIVITVLIIYFGDIFR
jgi:serine/threonine-protein kinase